MNGKKVLLVDDFAIDSDVICRNVQNLERIADIVRIWCLFCDATKFDDSTKDIQDDFSHVIYNTTWEMRTIIGRINNVLNYLNIRTNYNGSKINTDKEINSLLGGDTYYLKKDERILNYDFSKLMVSFYDKDNILRENGIKFFIRFYQN